MMESDPGSAKMAEDEIERALMELGPLLGVSVKEEAPEDIQECLPAATTSQGSAEGKSMGGGGPDSLAREEEGSGAFTAPKCAFCAGPVAAGAGADAPRLLECLHSACAACFAAKVDERVGVKDALTLSPAEAAAAALACGACRLVSPAGAAIEQRFLAELHLAEAPPAAPHCAGCGDAEPATSYCRDCAEFICDACVRAHQRLKITKEHTIAGKEAGVAAGGGGGDAFCRDHPHERLALFCETCERLTCRDCQLTQHRDHKYQFSKEMAAQARTSLAALLAEVSYKRVLLGSAMRVIRDRQALIADKKRALVTDITQAVVKLTEAVNTRGKQLVLRLGEVCALKQRTLADKKRALEQLAAITDHGVQFAGAALQRASDAALLHAAAQLRRHLQRIKSKRADIPNPEIPVRVALALDKLPDLLRVLAAFGGILVDGKADSSASSSSSASSASSAAPAAPPASTSQGPYHHSAVAALQHVALHQSVCGGSPSPSGSPVPMATAPPAYPGSRPPLRHPHVTSTTHPHYHHHLHAGLGDLNLRGLLNHAGHAAARAHLHAPLHVQHHQHQMQQQQQALAAQQQQAMQLQARHSASAPYFQPQAQMLSFGGGGGGRGQQHQQMLPPKWHTPQSQAQQQAQAQAQADFKIALPRLPPLPPPPAVTSTNPKTPSPGAAAHDPALSLDKLCAASVQDLMATIAKLDSNGVQVVAEAGEAPSPLVHSSTASAPAVGGSGAAGGGDPNEDWCAVCMDGGELMCCDRCPKVFHQYCHIPTIEKLPAETESWQCLLCVNFAERPPAEPRRLLERITLELYCQYELSLPFREPVPPENVAYHRATARPMCLDAVRARLQLPPSSPAAYQDPAAYVADVRLIFRNARAFNAPDSPLHADAARLEAFFEAQVAKWLPSYSLPPSTSTSTSTSTSPSDPKRPRLL